MKCEAKGVGWSCPVDAKTSGLCSGHYRQDYRKAPLRPLRGAHGATGEDLQQVNFMAPRADLKTLAKAAADRAVKVSEVYREAFATLAEKLRKK